MNKKEIAAALEETGMLLELSGENPFKVRSYFNTARALQQLEADLETLVREKRLREIKGVGEALEQKIEELVATGRLAFLEELRARYPESLFELFGIQGLGPKRIKALYEELGIDSREKLAAACREDRIAKLKGFSAKMQENILESIAFAGQFAGQHLADAAEAAAEVLMERLCKVKDVQRLEVAGSLRRRKELIKDIDILAAAKDGGALMEAFVSAPEVIRVVAHGPTKSSVALESGIAADLRVVAPEAFPFAWHYFTGSKEHNIVMRQRARDRGLKLNEYGLFREDGAPVPCKDEAELFEALDLPWIPPELREDRGEFDDAPLPELLRDEDIRGVIHCHTTYSDGLHSVAEMAEAAREFGYEYIVICDHSQSAGYANGLKPDRVLEQHAEIDALNKRLRGFRVLKGIESDIRGDGSLDYDQDILAAFDLVVASVHSKLGMSEDEATARVVKAIENPYTCILGHPTGRLLLGRPGYPLDMDKVFDACIANRVAIEINANCHRLDIDWRHIRKGRDKGAVFAIGPDAHNRDAIRDIRHGAGIARKGWLEARHVINCLNAKELLAWRA